METCAICKTTNSKKYYLNPDGSGSYICAKDYLKMYKNKRNSSRTERYKNDPVYRDYVLTLGKKSRANATPEQAQKRKEKRREKYLADKASGRIDEYKSKNKDRILEYKAAERKRNAYQIFKRRAVHQIENREKIKIRLAEYSKRISTRFLNLKYSAERREINLDLTFEQYCTLIESGKCYYCSADIFQGYGYGIDRKINSLGYFFDNCVPCCQHCNKIKGDTLTAEQTKVALDAMGPVESTLRHVLPFNSVGAHAQADKAIQLLLNFGLGGMSTSRWSVSFSGKMDVHVQPLSVPHVDNKADSNVLIFRPSEIIKNTGVVRNYILRSLGNSSQIVSARDCEIRRLDLSMASIFFSRHFFESFELTPAIGFYSGGQLLAAVAYVLSHNTAHLEIKQIAFKDAVLVTGVVDAAVEYISIRAPSSPLVSMFLNSRYEKSFYLEGSYMGYVGLLETWDWTDGINLFKRNACRDNLDQRLMTEDYYASEKGWQKIYEDFILKFVCKNKYYGKEMGILPEAHLEHTRIDSSLKEYAPQKYSDVHSELRLAKYSELRDMIAQYFNFKLLTSFEEYSAGLAGTRTVCWICDKNHRNENLVRHFKDFKCPACKLARKSDFEQKLATQDLTLVSGEYLGRGSTLTVVCGNGHQITKIFKDLYAAGCPSCAGKVTSTALGGTAKNRRREIYNRIVGWCSENGYVLQTEWEEFELSDKSSRITSIALICPEGHFRKSTWATLLTSGCKGCISDGRRRSRDCIE